MIALLPIIFFVTTDIYEKYSHKYRYCREQKKKTGRQNQTLAQWKILHCKTHDGAAGVFEIEQVF
jgi:hypothetical protein